MRFHQFISGALLLLALPVVPAHGAGAILHKSGPIQITADGGFVWVVNPDHGSVSRLRVADNAVMEFPLPAGEFHRPLGLAVTADGAEVWVAASESDRVFVLDGNTGTVVDELPEPLGSAPVSTAISPDGSRVLVALSQRGAVSVYDRATRVLVTRIEGLFRQPRGIAFTTDPNEAWLTHTITDGEDSHLTALDLGALNVAARVILKSVNPKSPSQIAGDPDPIPEGGYLLLRGHLAPQPGGNRLWFPVQYQNFHNPQFTPDSTVQAALHKIDLTTKTVAQGDRVVLSAVYAHDNTTLVGDGWNAGIAGPIDLGFSADGSTVYLVNAHSNDVVILPSTISLERPPGAPPLPEIPVGDHPLGIVVSPVAEKAYVVNSLSRDVSVIDLATESEEARIPITPDSPEPLPADFLVGARLFNSSADPRLSSNGKVACASCHPDTESDGLLWQFAPLGAGQRMTLGLRGLALSFGPPAGGLGQLHRSGDRDEVQDFEFTARSPLMGGAGFLASPNPPLAASNAGLDADLDAIATYLLGLPPRRLSAHRADDGTLTPAATRGAAIYQNTSGGPVDTGCIGCHPDPAFTDLGFHDVGGFAPDPENEGPLFNTPSLVGAWSRGPFVQVTGWADGQSLGGVVRNATGTHGDTTGLTRRQARDLEVFLESIDGELATTGLSGIADADPPRILSVQPVSRHGVEVIFDETVDPITAGDPANYLLTDGVVEVSPTAATVDTATGDRVRLAVDLAYPGCDVTYTLLPGPIEDVAGSISGGTNNALDPQDPANHSSFTLDGTITVTFGDTGLETFNGVARDASFNPGLGNVSHWNWRIYPFTSPEMKGFVAFDFASILASECEVTDASQIVDARFDGLPFLGHRQNLELHRCLMPWGEPPRDWCFGCGGTLTRNHSTHPSIPWHQSGAGAYGGSGTNPAEYYPTGSFDLAATVDATSTAPGINERLEFSGPLVTDAFRFWFDNPSLNHGYSVEVAGGGGATGIEFVANDAEAGRQGFVLRITFTIPTTVSDDCNGNGIDDACDIAAGTSPDTNGNGIPDECEGPGSPFVRGDCNADGSFNIADPLALLNQLFVPGTPPASCSDACDGNDDEVLDLADAIGFLGALFDGGPSPAPPFPGCGADPAGSALGCSLFPPCP